MKTQKLKKKFGFQLNNMKLFLKIIILLISINVYGQELQEIKNFGSNPGNLRMFYFNPNPDNSIKKSIVIALHGCGQSAESFNKITDWTKLATEENFILIFPQQKTSNNTTKCFNWFQEKDYEINSGENQSVMEMLAYTQKNNTINDSKIYITGVSAGAAMSTAIAYTHPNIFSGICSYAGGPYGIAKNEMSAFRLMNGKIDSKEVIESFEKMSSKNELKIPKLIIFHGKKDNIVDYSNSELLIKQWCATFQIDSSNTSKKNNYLSNNEITKIDYIEHETSQIVLYSIESLAHKYLVDPDNKTNSGGGKLNFYSKDLDFFATYYIALEFDLINSKHD